MRQPPPLVPLALLLLGFFAASLWVPNFLDLRYLLESSTLHVEVGLLALGLTFVIATGEIDLSVGSTLALTACLTAMFLGSGASPVAAVVFACGCGTLLGAANGALVAALRLPSFLVTLGTMAAYRGIAQAAMGAQSARIPEPFKGLDQSWVFGVPWPLVVLFALAVVLGLVLHRSVFGRWVVAVGTNERAAHCSGIPIGYTKVAAFALTGLLAGVGSVLLDSRLGVARFDLARGVELDAITVAVVGGAAVQGGKGSVAGTVVALFLLVVLRTAMGLASVKPEYQLTAIGALLVVAVLAENAAQLLQARRQSAAR